MIVGCTLCVMHGQQLLQTISTGWILTKLGSNDPYMALFDKHSDGSNPLHI